MARNGIRSTLIACASAAFMFAACGKKDNTSSSTQNKPQGPTAPMVTRPSPTVTMGGTSATTSPSGLHPVGANAPVTATTTRPATVSPPAESKVATFAGFSGPKPVTWIWHPPANPNFSIAEYTVPGQGGGDQAKITVSKAGGTIDA